MSVSHHDLTGNFLHFQVPVKPNWTTVTLKAHTHISVNVRILLIQLWSLELIVPSAVGHACTLLPVRLVHLNTISTSLGTYSCYQKCVVRYDSWI